MVLIHATLLCHDCDTILRMRRRLLSLDSVPRAGKSKRGPQSSYESSAYYWTISETLRSREAKEWRRALHRGPGKRIWNKSLGHDIVDAVRDKVSEWSITGTEENVRHSGFTLPLNIFYSKDSSLYLLAMIQASSTTSPQNKTTGDSVNTRVILLYTGSDS